MNTPAGPMLRFGKSTLLAAWREDESRERPVAWLTLDEGDNDAVALWAHVVEALCRACPGLAHEALSTLVVSAPLLEVVLPRLVNELAEQDDVVLVLDDFHRLSSSSSRELCTAAGDRYRTSTIWCIVTGCSEQNSS